MKLAIPTDDGLMMTRNFGSAKGFLILTIKSGEITEQQLRWNISGNPGISDDNITDCDGILVKEIEDKYRQQLNLKNKEIINSDDQIITKAVIHFLAEYLHRESNYCCCP
ncbi:MAG: hypothetical protein NTW49_00420 [Bacteroidia bacterium]|nr:hypothetical protein [Bacteroidia bacterium]